MGFISLPKTSGGSVLKFPSFASFPPTGIPGTFYYDESLGDMYFWNGVAYESGAGGPANTDGLPEGSVNLYYTNARADARAQLAVDNHVAEADPHPQYAFESQVEAFFEEAMVFQNYQVNELDDAGGGVTYVGKAKVDGKWLIEKLTETGDDLAKVYANESNNIGTTTFTTAWTNRASLTYGQIQTLTGL
jgi:hypothetical protein